MTAFHTPTFPVWLVAMSWLPTKKRASAGTLRLKTPAGREKPVCFCFCYWERFPSSSNLRPDSREHCAETRTDFIAVAIRANGPEDDLRHRGDSHHLVVVSQRPAHHFGVERDSVDHPVEAGRGEDLLPPGRLLHPERGGGKKEAGEGQPIRRQLAYSGRS